MNDFCPLLKAIETYLAKADDDLGNTLGKQGFISPKETVKEINRLEEAISKILDRQRSYFIEGMKGEDLNQVLHNLWPSLKKGDPAAEEIKNLFETELSSVLNQLCDAYIKRTDKALSFRTFTSRTLDWISSWSEELGETMQLTTHEGLEAILSAAISEGKSVQTVTQELSDWYGFSRKRARATAITEMLTTHSVAAQEAYTQSPAVEEKEWQHTGAHKNNPRLNHQAMDGKRVGVNERYTLIGADGLTYYPMYPGDTLLPPSERVNCHCNSLPIVSAKVLGLPIEERKRLQQQAIDEANQGY